MDHRVNETFCNDVRDSNSGSTARESATYTTKSRIRQLSDTTYKLSPLSLNCIVHIFMAHIWYISYGIFLVKLTSIISREAIQSCDGNSMSAIKQMSNKRERLIVIAHTAMRTA